LRLDLAKRPEFCGLFKTPCVATWKALYHNGAFHTFEDASDIVAFLCTLTDGYAQPKRATAITTRRPTVFLRAFVDAVNQLRYVLGLRSTLESAPLCRKMHRKSATLAP
jgi:cytochrome c peroxidase